MSDVFALALQGCRVRIDGTQNELMNGLTGRVVSVRRLPRPSDGGMPAYCEFQPDNTRSGVLIVPTTCLRLAGNAVAAE